MIEKIQLCANYFYYAYLISYNCMQKLFNDLAKIEMYNEHSSLTSGQKITIDMLLKSINQSLLLREDSMSHPS